MARPEKDIPLKDKKIKGLLTLIKEGKTHQEIADYYGVERSTITKKIKKMEESENK